MDCRPGCGACCIAPSISSPIPGHPRGKPAGVPCAQLDGDLRCRLFGRPERPAVCRDLRCRLFSRPEPGMCRDDRGQALAGLAYLEQATGRDVADTSATDISAADPSIEK